MISQNGSLRHEALHTVYVLMDTFSRHVVEHPFILANSEFESRAIDISEAMAEFYQQIGRASIDVDPPAPPASPIVRPPRET